MFQVVKDDSLSLSDLIRLAAQGRSVVRTPHVGSWYPSNIGVATVGIRSIVYDRTFGTADKNYHPNYVVEGGKKHLLGDPHLLMTHVTSKVEYSCGNKVLVECGDLVVDAHMRSLRHALPHANLERYSVYLQQHAELVQLICTFTAPVLLEEWRRFVEVDGCIQDRRAYSWAQIAREGILGIDSPTKGWLIPNILNVLICAAVEAILTNDAEVWHLSGPDMHRYVDGYAEKLTSAYDCCLQGGMLLPPVLRFIVVPIAGLRFVVPTSRRVALDAIVDAYLTVSGKQSGYGDLIKAAEPEFRIAAIAIVAKQREKDKSLIGQAIKDCPEVFYDIERADYWSQYDLLRSMEETYISPWALEVPVRVLDHAYAYLKRCR